MLQDRVDVEEVLQEIYIKVWNNVGFYCVDMVWLMIWLIVIVCNYMLDMLRCCCQVVVELDEVGEIVDLQVGFEEMVVLILEGWWIEDCMCEFEEDCVVVVCSVYVEGMSYLELVGLYGVFLNMM